MLTGGLPIDGILQCLGMRDRISPFLHLRRQPFQAALLADIVSASVASKLIKHRIPKPRLDSRFRNILETVMADLLLAGLLARI